MNKHLSQNLSGYRKGFSTQTALAMLPRKRKKVLDDIGCADAVLMDLSKAFDTINHELLIAKLIYVNDLFFTLSSVNACNFVDDTTSFVYDLNLEVVLTQLVIPWSQNNYMELNTDKCHLFVAGHKFDLG